MLSKIGVIGLGVMGKAIAKNIASKGYKVSVYNKTTSKMNVLLDEHIKEIVGFEEIKDFINSLEKPRKILMMVSAEAVETVIDNILPLLEQKDILIDGGNSFYKNTETRMEKCKDYGIDYIGMGISGGEKGALHGPSLMPSGSFEAYKQLESIFKDIAAKTSKKEACVSYIGKGGSGHFIKMVHNGIEYADMQLIAEVYGYLKQYYSNDEIADIFEKWNQGKLKSYLLEITIDILKYKEDGEYLLDKISDVVYHKQTGKWSSITGLELDVAIPSLIEAMQARIVTHKSRYKHSYDNNEPKSNVNLDGLEEAFYLSKIIIYDQGFEMMKKASEKYYWDLNLSEIAKIWQAGCIIQSSFIEELTEKFKTFDSIIYSSEIENRFHQKQESYRETISKIILSGIYAPVMLSTISYYEGIRSKHLSTNLIQAQRDYFGSHTYERIDEEGIFHTKWNQI